MSHSEDALQVVFTVPKEEFYALKLTPCLSTEDCGPPLPVHGRAVRVVPGDSKGVPVPMMGYVHVNIVPLPDRPDTRSAPFHGRCAVIIKVPPDGSRSHAKFVTVNEPGERGGPPDPDLHNALRVTPGEIRHAFMRDGHWMHLHEEVRFGD
jgi:hypothetical protein